LQILRSIDHQDHSKILNWLIIFVVSCVFLMVSPSYAVEQATTATATANGTDDQAIESAIVLNQADQQGLTVPTGIPLPQTPQPANNPASMTENTAPRPMPDESIVQAELPSLNQPVIDQSNTLSANAQQQLSQQILDIYQSGRAQIGLIVLPSTGQEAIFDYAVRAFTAWQLGDKKHDNGLLIVVAVNDRKIQILTGYGLEGVLPDVVIKRIIEEQITPEFKQNNYSAGLQAGIIKIDSILQLDPDVARAAAEQLKQQQEQQAQQANAMQRGFITLLVLSVLGMFAAMFLGRSLSASLAAVGGVAWGLISGLGLFASVLLGIGVFFLLITSLAQLILQIFLSGGGRGGGSGGFGGGSSYSGGGGSFGGGGASGSW
jgi:uncharacterized protein